MGQGCSLGSFVQPDHAPPVGPSSSSGVSARGRQNVCEGWTARHGTVVCMVAGKEVVAYSSRLGKRVNSMFDPKGPVTCLLSQLNALFTGSVDWAVRRWDLETCQQVFECIGHDGAVWCLAMAEGMLFSSSEDTTIIGWCPSSGSRLTRMKQHTLPVRCLLDVGEALVSGADDGSLICWELQKFEPLATTQAHSSAITCMVRLDDGGVFTGCADGSISRWAQQCRVSIGPLEGHSQWVTYLLATQEWLFSASRDCTIRRWDLETGALSLCFDLGTISLRHPPCGMLVINDGGGVKLTHTPDEDKFIKVVNEDGTLSLLAHSGRYLTAPLTGRVMAIHDSIGELERFAMLRNSDGTVSMKTSCGSYWTVLPEDNSVETVMRPEGATSMRERFVASACDPHWGAVTCLALVNGCLMSGSADRSVKLWDPECGVLVASMDARSGITCLLDAGDALWASVARGSLLRLPRPRKFPKLKFRRHVFGHPAIVSEIISNDACRQSGDGIKSDGLGMETEDVNLQPDVALRSPPPRERGSPGGRSPQQQLPTVAPPMSPPIGLPSLESPGRAVLSVGLRPPLVASSPKVIEALWRPPPL